LAIDELSPPSTSAIPDLNILVELAEAVLDICERDCYWLTCGFKDVREVQSEPRELTLLIAT
jgi:hypothetical protein